MSIYHNWADNMPDEAFEKLPLLREGESKEIRGTPEDGLCLIKLKPTIYSFTANRSAVVPGSDALRLRACKIFHKVLQDNHIQTSYRYVGKRYILSDYIPRPPNIEVIVKAYHSGTSKHRYFQMATTPIRNGIPLRSNSPWAGMTFGEMDAYPHTIVRFDWRNPMYHPDTNKRLADEVLCDEMADWYIDTKQARLTAHRTFLALSSFLADRNISLYDLCLFVTEDGRTVFGEISPDCGRFRHFDLGELDKDVWRAGGSSEQVLDKWRLLCEMIEEPPKGKEL